MRSFINHTVSSVTFIAGLLALLFLVSQIVMPKGNAPEDGVHDPVANGILGEPDHGVDVLILGDSESYCSMIPLRMWEKYGLTSYCCGTPGQKLCYSQEFLYKTFRNQSPKIVILETDMIFRDFSIGDSLVYRTDFFLPVFSYHSRWKSLKPRDLIFTINYTYRDDTKGYLFNNTASEASVADYMKPSEDYAPIAFRNRNYMKKIKSFCDKNGAKLILVSTPSTINWNSTRHNSMQKLSEELNLDYIDMNLMREEIPIDWKKDTRDAGDHLNYYGAEKVTAYLGKYLWETGLLSDHRGDEKYKHWNEALESFNKTVLQH